MTCLLLPCPGMSLASEPIALILRDRALWVPTVHLSPLSPVAPHSPVPHLAPLRPALSPSTPASSLLIFISADTEIKKLIQPWEHSETGPRAPTSKEPQGEVGWRGGPQLRARDVPAWAKGPCGLGCP